MPKFKRTVKAVRDFLKSRAGGLPDDIALVRNNYANSPIYRQPTVEEVPVKIEAFLPKFAEFLLTAKPSPDDIAPVAARVNKFFGNQAFVPGSDGY